VVAGNDTFSRTTKEIVKCVGQNFKEGSKFCTGMENLVLPNITKPTDPSTEASMVKLKSGNWPVDTMRDRWKFGRKIQTGH